MNNWRRHREDRAGLARSWNVDPFSTGVAFYGWKELENATTLFRPPPTYDGLVVWRPRTWLLREGWMKHGAVSVQEVPGPDRPDRTR